MQLNSGKCKHSLPHFYRSVAKRILQFQWSTLHPGSEMIYYNYHFYDELFLYPVCFLQWCAVFHRNNLKQNLRLLFHGCSDRKTSWWRKQNTVAKMVITIIWLPDGSENHCGTVRIWDQGGAILWPRVSQTYSEISVKITYNSFLSVQTACAADHGWT